MPDRSNRKLPEQDCNDNVMPQCSTDSLTTPTEYLRLSSDTVIEAKGPFTETNRHQDRSESMEVKHRSDDTANHLEPSNCNVCGKETSSYCPCCFVPAKDGSGGRKVFYCGSACQKQDWKQHKSKRDKAAIAIMMHRIGVLLNEIWLIQREETHDVPVIDAKLEDGALVIHDGMTADKESCPVFLLNVLNGEGEKELRAAALCESACDEALIMASEIVAELLDCTGFAFVAEEVFFQVKNITRRTKVVFSDGTRRFADYEGHYVLRVWFKTTDQCFAVDLSGAQYGWKEVVIPWDAYEREKVGDLIQVRYLGWQSKTARLAEDPVTFVSGIDKSKVRHFQQLQVFKASQSTHAFKHWVQQFDRAALKALLLGSSSEFESKKRELLQQVSNQLHGTALELLLEAEVISEPGEVEAVYLQRQAMKSCLDITPNVSAAGYIDKLC